jgi:hypothetical protein
VEISWVYIESFFLLASALFFDQKSSKTSCPPNSFGKPKPASKTIHGLHIFGDRFVGKEDGLRTYIQAVLPRIGGSEAFLNEASRSEL